MKLAPVFAAALIALAAPATAQTIAEVQAKATTGDRQSQFLLGEAYRTGQGVTPDREMAIAWFRKANAQGDTRAADALGLLLFTKGERREAIPLLEAAATRSDARALYLLGTARFNGDGVTKNLPRAYAEMRAAADMGLPQAIRSLQLMETYISDKDRLASQAIRPTQMSAATAPDAEAPSVMIPSRPPLAAAAGSLTAPSVSPARVSQPTPSAPTPIRTTIVPPSTPVIASTTEPAIAAPVKAPPPPKPKPIPAKATGKWRVQLGAIVTQARAEEQWRMLAKKVPQLSRLTHATVQAGAIWRLQATGLASLSEAKDLCKAVTAKSGDCIPLSPAP